MTFEQWWDANECIWSGQPEPERTLRAAMTAYHRNPVLATPDTDTPEQQAYRDGYAQGKEDAENEQEALTEVLSEFLRQAGLYGSDAFDLAETTTAINRVVEVLNDRDQGEHG